jgi:hypothetical protein
MTPVFTEHFGNASSIMFLLQHGVRYESFAFAYRTGLPKQLNVLSRPTGTSDVLRGTLVISASGHVSGTALDRLVGWAEAELVVRGYAIGDDAARYLDLRSACDAAHRSFATDYQRTHRYLPLHITDGPTIELSRARYDALLGAHQDGEDAQRGNTALLHWFGATNTYHVRVRLPDGQVLERSGIPRNRLDRIELATRIPVEFPLQTGTTVLQAWPAGSAEVGSYREAREYAIHHGRELLSVKQQIAIAEKYQALHPEVRWGTEFEMDDVLAQGVSPSPYPYEDF